MRTDRLLKLAAHLESGKLAHEKFDFAHYNSPPFKKNGCGTSGCAIGECPALFPEDWEWARLEKFWDKSKQPRLKGNFGNSKESGMTFFEIGEDEYNHLFIPSEIGAFGIVMQFPEDYGGKLLYMDATPAEVAANIRAFVHLFSPTTNNNEPNP